MATEKLRDSKFKYEVVSDWEDEEGTLKNYTWDSVPGEDRWFGATVHEPPDEIIPLSVQIYPSAFQSVKSRETLCAHVLRQAVLHEYIHTLQAQRARQADPNWKDFKSYELYDNEVEAWNLSRSWYYALYGTRSPIPMLSESQSDFSSSSKFLEKKKEYQDYEDKKAKGTLTEDDKKKMNYLEEWFRKKDNLPDAPGRGGGYDANAKLECRA